MNNVIQLHEHRLGGDTVQTVNAREMYEALGLNKAHWARWSKQNVAENPFALKGQDYEGFTIMVNGNKTTDYALSVGFAKKLAMQVPTQKGEDIRDYFIECEEIAKQANPRELSRMEILELAMESEKQNQVLKLENKAKDERIEKLESFFHPGMTITAFGKMLNGVNCSQMNNFCRDTLKWIYNESRSGKNRRFRARSYARDRYLTETDRPIGTHGGETFIKHEPKLLKAGAKKLYELYLDEKLPMKKTWNGEFVHIKFEVAA